MSIVLQSSGGGQITINEPATASNFTQTLPAADGTILTSGSPQSGGVIQLVQSISTTQFNTTSATDVATGYSATIIPKFSNSKILITVVGNVYQNTVTQTVIITPYRNTTALAGQSATSYVGSQSLLGFSINYLDSPATTASTTYNIYAKTSGGTASLVSFGGSITITLTEIAA
jgi:hypothetical protein